MSTMPMSSSALGIYSLGPSFKINYSNCCPRSFQGTFFSERKNLLNYYFWKLKNPNAALFFKPYLRAFCAHAIVHFYVCNHLCFAPAPPNRSLTVQFSIYFIVLFRVISPHTVYLCPNPECLIPLGFFSSIRYVI